MSKIQLQLTLWRMTQPFILNIRLININLHFLSFIILTFKNLLEMMINLLYFKKI